jgi:phytoene dehydrogenase-like protein
MDRESSHVVVIGGGLAGLTAAVLLGRAGARVTVCERSGEPGGRAATHVRDGFHLNLGPHALYVAGAAARELAAIGLSLAGGVPSGGWALRAGKLHTLPTGAVSLLSTGLLSFSAKRRAVAWLARLGRLDPTALADVPLGRFIDETAPEPEFSTSATWWLEARG